MSFEEVKAILKRDDLAVKDEIEVRAFEIIMLITGISLISNYGFK